MKVALLTDSEVFAGTERHILDLAQILCENGVDAHIACPARSVLATMARQETLPVFGLETAGLRAFVAVNRMRVKLRTGQWELIHAHNGRSALLAALARWLARRGYLVTTQHFIDPARTKRRSWRARLAGFAHRWVDGQTAGIIAISEAVKAALLMRDATPPAKVHVAINGIRDPAEKNLASSDEVRAQLGVSGAAPLIVCVCRLEPEKSVETLVQAMPSVLTEFPDAVCMIGGAGSEMEKIAREIVRLGLGRSVKLLGFQADPHPLMRAATVFVLPSRAEPFGLVLVEAMALRRPCIATMAGGPMEIIVENESGTLVYPDNPEALADALRRLLGSPALREHLGTSARARYEEKFTVARMGLVIESVYRKTIAIPPAS